MTIELAREYRFAVVFYGGVSLAVYENGVARAFYDAAQGLGMFKVLSQMLDARFVVDVISGASAGGINGLMLAAALESGADFSQTAALWREAGGLQELLKPVEDAGGTESLLSESYYLEQLRFAFRQVCTAPEERKGPPPKEIDVHVTGTDLNGQITTFVDAVGTPIEVKNHALVFHLKHRSGRTRLGVIETIDEQPSPDQLSLQVDTLSSVARITSSFPGAFPPFTFSELEAEQLHPLTATALTHLAANSQSASLDKSFELKAHHLVDGGVLENSPFGPVLEAIFHRVPSPDATAVERTLFYVEPDPKVSSHDGAFTPLQVALESVISLPGYDGIAGDLQMLRAHNDSVRRAAALRARVRQKLFDKASSPPEPTSQEHAAPTDNIAYESALLDCIACALVGAPPTDIAEIPNLHTLARALHSRQTAARTLPNDIASLRALDVNYHLRKAFYALYPPAAALEGGEPSAPLDTCGRAAIGRVVKALKLLRDVWLSVMRKHERTTPLTARQSSRGTSKAAIPAELESEVDFRVNLLRRYLNGEWFLATSGPQAVSEVANTNLTTLMASGAASAPSAKTLRAQQVAESLLNSDSLQLMRDQAIEWLGRELRARSASAQAGHTASSVTAGTAALPPGAMPLGSLQLEPPQSERVSMTAPRVLVALERVLLAIAPEAVREFPLIDANVFPSELAGEIYELDEVEVVRIAPKDPHLPGEARIKGSDKVTGDLLAHFSAFFRRDWRSNDIAWGHSDALCQIVRTVFTQKQWEQVRGNGPEWQAAIKDGLVAEGADAQLLAAFEALCQASDEDRAKRFDAFRDLFIAHAQEQALAPYVKLVQQDREFQHTDWNWQGPKLAEALPNSAVDTFVKWRLGGRTITAETPTSLLLQYAGQAGVLVSEMLKPSANEGPAAHARKLTRFVVPVMWLLSKLGGSVRRERSFVLALLFASFVGGLGFALAGVLAGSWPLSMFGLVLALAPVALAYAFSQHLLATGLVFALIGTVWFVAVKPISAPLRTRLGTTLIAMGKAVAPRPKGQDAQRQSQGAQRRGDSDAEREQTRPKRSPRSREP